MKSILLLGLTILLLPFSYAQNELTVYFDTDAYALNKQQQAQIKAWGEKNTISSNLKINAYTDQRGSESYNQKLSEKRAESVAHFIQETFDINLSKTAVFGHGEISEGILKDNRKVVIQMNEGKPKNVVENSPESIDKVDFSKVKVGDKLNLANIIFEGGRRYVLPQSKEALDQITKILLEHKNYHFEIQGHVCCTRPDEVDGEDNDTGIRNLSEMRALQIYKYFKANGIDESRMEYVGLGGKFPLGGEVMYDRRVEIEITKIE